MGLCTHNGPPLYDLSFHFFPFFKYLFSISDFERFLNFWGFPGARLSHNQSVRGNHPSSFTGHSERRPGLVFRLLSPLLFFAPEFYLASLEDTYVDKIIKMRTWKVFESKMENVLAEYILDATVLLNANVGYLSIPTVQSDQTFPTFWTSSASIASMASMITSLGSIITGLLLMRQQKAGGEHAEMAVRLLEKRANERSGSEVFAILYSLPYALLLWA